MLEEGEIEEIILSAFSPFDVKMTTIDARSEISFEVIGPRDKPISKEYWCPTRYLRFAPFLVAFITNARREIAENKHRLDPWSWSKLLEE